MKHGKEASRALRRMTARVGFLAVIAVRSLGVQAQSTAICDPTQLQEALCGAQAGTIVRIGDCAVAGSFRVPAGVILEGGGSSRSFITVPGGAIGVVVEAGTPPTVLRSLSINSSGLAAILVLPGESASVSNVSVTASLGIGIGAEDVGSLDLSNVSLQGPVTSANAHQVSPLDATPDVIATHGLVLVRVGASA